MPVALIVSRQFPPIGSIGASIRLIKFIKYIAIQGWEFIVLTQDQSNSVLNKTHQSNSLEAEIPPETLIERIPVPFLSRKQKAEFKSILSRFLPLFGSLGWGFRVFFHAVKQFKSNDIDIIYTLTPTIINALIGAALSWYYGKPLVLDMKDDWVGSPDYYSKNFIQRKLEFVMEFTIIRQASKVILVTDRSYRQYIKRYESLETSNKFHLIPNGCDLAEYGILKGKRRQVDPNHFVILSAAWGYKSDYRDIKPFFLAVHKFLSLQPAAKNNLEIVFLGNSLSKEYLGLMKKTGIFPYIREFDSLTREEFIQSLWQADLFFLVQPKENTTSISGTLYEYWATGKAPTLLISEKGASSYLVENYSLGKSFRYEEINSISDYINENYTNHQNLNPVYINSDGIEAFDRKNLANQMSKILQDCIIQREKI